ncbi:PQQ-dependent sugar dehydrogenase [Lutimonas zeaxanthinifaciens]|uniref:PQQ-dependent sugar dehydrogenase n=1 Tax=Lutimonas zeaxanthinifaciens TaxID=3060215 RepID=UPI00265D3B3A|nr:PQQ-dependent sugar dehydrogenase [Lutimonas sp. YSD2104]WKK65827.1 PQQ-dependent sugar dehydrogenase [Lutimonas sp. YSD2104]
MKKILFTVCCLSVFLIQCQKNTDFKSTDDFNYKAETVVDNLEIAWGFEFLPDGSILIAEQEGKMILYKDGNRTEINDVPKVYYDNQGGLLDVKLHPDYENNGWIYFSYSGNTEDDDKGSNTVIMRAKLKDNSLIDKEVIYKATPNTKKGHHFGSRIEFDHDGYLFFSVGDRGNRDVNPQDINRDGGKIYRLNDDGSIPADNPFVSMPGSKAAVYSYGHRNPQGMALHQKTGKIWIHEHGPQGGDEINIIESGKNYGWPIITYGINYDGSEITDKTEMPGMEQPIHYWVPSIAPSGMAFINSDIYPSWKGHLLVGSLKFQYLNLVRLENNAVISEEKLMEDLGRVRTVKIGPDGYIYVSVEQLGIVRLMPY